MTSFFNLSRGRRVVRLLLAVCPSACSCGFPAVTCIEFLLSVWLQRVFCGSASTLLGCLLNDLFCGWRLHHAASRNCCVRHSNSKLGARRVCSDSEHSQCKRQCFMPKTYSKWCLVQYDLFFKFWRHSDYVMQKCEITHVHDVIEKNDPTC